MQLCVSKLKSLSIVGCFALFVCMLLLLICWCLLSCKSIFNNCVLIEHYHFYFLIFSKPANFHFVGNRRHPSPTKEMLEPLLRTAFSVGLNLDVSSSKALAESLDNAKVRPLCIILLFGCFINIIIYDNRLLCWPFITAWHAEQWPILQQAY